MNTQLNFKLIILMITSLTCFGCEEEQPSVEGFMIALCPEETRSIGQLTYTVNEGEEKITDLSEIIITKINEGTFSLSLNSVKAIDSENKSTERISLILPNYKFHALDGFIFKTENKTTLPDSMNILTFQIGVNNVYTLSSCTGTAPDEDRGVIRISFMEDDDVICGFFGAELCNEQGEPITINGSINRVKYKLKD